MRKSIVSSLLLMLFLGLISAPTILHIIDDTIDISIFYSLAEEEERGHQTVKNVEIITSDVIYNAFLIGTSERFSTIGYQYRTYPKPHLNLISPPPELHIL